MTSDDSISDQQLLREFALSQSQSAFRTLVERHQSMVFGTARRRMLSDAAAADVAQNVFLALARKAAWLSARTNVGGWLYKSTLMESARRQRDEMRRGSRERLYSEEMNIRGTSDEDTDAPRAADLMPLLDDALSGLSDADREAIMLRFFRGLSLRETGAAMGTTEEAARKRVSRALEKLSSVFKRRGTAVSASLLAASLLPEAADAAVPAGLAAKVSTAAAALPATSSAGLLFLKAAALSKTHVAAACLTAAAIPVTYQAVSLHDLRLENARLSALASSSSSVSPRPSAFAIATGSPIRSNPPGGTRANTSDSSSQRHDDHRANRFAEFWETERRQQRAARLLAMDERLGLDENQLTAAAQIAEQMDADTRAAMEASRANGSQPDHKALAAIRTAADNSLVTLLSEDQRDAFSRFKSEEERNRQEVYAGSMLGDMQKSLLLSDSQKDRLFSLFSTQAAANGGDPGPWAWAHLMQPDQSATLSAILTEEQFNLWKQRYETFGRMFGGPPRSEPPAAKPGADPATKP